MKHKILMKVLDFDEFVEIYLDGKRYEYCEYPSELAYAIKNIIDAIEDKKEFEVEIKEVDTFNDDDDDDEEEEEGF